MKFMRTYIAIATIGLLTSTLNVYAAAADSDSEIVAAAGAYRSNLDITKTEFECWMDMPLYKQDLSHIKGIDVIFEKSRDHILEERRDPDALGIRLFASISHLNSLTIRLIADSSEARIGASFWNALGTLAPSLESLSFISNTAYLSLDITPLTAIAWQKLAHLDITYLSLKHENVASLANSPHMRKLQRLSLIGGDIGDDDAETLANSENMPLLHDLILGGNRIIQAVKNRVMVDIFRRGAFARRLPAIRAWAAARRRPAGAIARRRPVAASSGSGGMAAPSASAAAGAGASS